MLDPRSWTKSPQPVFATNEQIRQYGPGHSSFTVAEDGKTDVLVYHARDYRDITGDPLYDPNRHTRVQQLHWNDDGTPSFGVSVGKGGPIVRLSPLDSPNVYVRHYEYRLRVDGNVREVADSQFRIVPGFSGAGSVALQSVNFPDRYARVADSVTVRIDQNDQSDSYARAASFVQVTGLADNRAVSFRQAGDPAAYLAHDNGRFVIARPAAAQRDPQRASFWLS
ncbi:AbfB domain-containing protein [Amycolatopsis sp. NPDC059657]|uniref:AbfB domain-containing protein n=1 Tax=Amycolatopsis sp. NPDC059657 TaxID=3346899 RepID=UPI003671182A